MKIAKSSLNISNAWSRTRGSYSSRVPRLFTTSATQCQLETISKCPDPTCPCAASPADLDIDRSKPLQGTMATYDEHVVIRTGVSDWTSRIEDDERFPLVKMLKQKLGRGGQFHDPFTNNMLTTSSSTSTSPSILLFPSFRAISSLHATPDAQADDPQTYTAKVDNLIRGFLLAKTPSQIPKAQFAQSQDATASTTPEPATSSQILRDASAAATFDQHEVQHLTVLICGHNERDSRCGILGPLLQSEFHRVLERKGWTAPEPMRDGSAEAIQLDDSKTAAVEMISHIGGHKFAGNVILYIPTGGSWNSHPLAGKGVWYGRVEPKHVQGIVEQTVEKGVIIKELFRGGMGKDKEIIRL